MFGSGFKYHKTLAPKIWDADMSINQLVSQSLQLIVWEFIHYLQLVGVPLRDENVRDILVYGSIADYYWDKYSDIDIRIVIDLSNVLPLLPAGTNWTLLYKALLRSWNATFDLSIYGRRIDMSISDASTFYDNGIQDSKISSFEILGSSYSLMRDTWVDSPTAVSPEQIRDVLRAARRRYRVIMRQCRHILKQKMSDTYIDAYIFNIKVMRNCYLNKDANTYTRISSMNIAYKMVKNSGMFKKLRRLSKQQRSKTYRLD